MAGTRTPGPLRLPRRLPSSTSCIRALAASVSSQGGRISRSTVRMSSDPPSESRDALGVAIGAPDRNALSRMSMNVDAGSGWIQREIVNHYIAWRSAIKYRPFQDGASQAALSAHPRNLGRLPCRRWAETFDRPATESPTSHTPRAQGHTSRPCDAPRGGGDSLPSVATSLSSGSSLDCRFLAG